MKKIFRYLFFAAGTAILIYFLTIVVLAAFMKPILSYPGVGTSVAIPVTSDTAYGNLFAGRDILYPDSMSYGVYRKQKDSIDRIQNYTNRKNGGAGTGESYGNLGVATVPDYPDKPADHYALPNSHYQRFIDTIAIFSARMAATPDKDSVQRLRNELASIVSRYNRSHYAEGHADSPGNLFYFTLGGYHLRNQDVSMRWFYVAHHSYHLLYLVPDAPDPQTREPRSHYESKQIPIRYNEQEKKILIPVSRKTHDFLAILFELQWYAVFLAWLILCVGLPLRILANLAAGKAFIRQNIVLFNIMAAGLGILAAIQVTGPYLLQMVLHNYIPSDFTLDPFINVFFPQSGSLLVAAGISS